MLTSTESICMVCSTIVPENSHKIQASLDLNPKENMWHVLQKQAFKKNNAHTHKNIHTCMPKHTHTHTHTHSRIPCLVWLGRAGMREEEGGGLCVECSKPGLVLRLVPDSVPSPLGSVARPPCARPTGSRDRPGQFSCSTGPIITQINPLLSLSIHDPSSRGLFISVFKPSELPT